MPGRSESAARRLTLDGARRRENASRARLVAVFLLGVLGFVGPPFWIASRPPGGGAADAWPAPFVFVFVFWAILIALIALVLRGSRRD